MPSDTNKTNQMNILLPDGWKERLERIAREKSIKEDRTITYSQMIRDMILELMNSWEKEKMGDKIEEN